MGDVIHIDRPAAVPVRPVPNPTMQERLDGLLSECRHIRARAVGTTLEADLAGMEALIVHAIRSVKDWGGVA